MTSLDCSNNSLTELNLLANTDLKQLNCQNNYISKAEVPAIPTGVDKSNWKTQPQNVVEISETNFPDEKFREYVSSEFDSDKNNWLNTNEIKTATNISLGETEIAKLTGIKFFTDLTYLDCNNNLLTSLDVSKNTALTTLHCNNNQLPSLDVSKNTALTYLSCSYNELTSLDVSENTALTELYCDNNQLTLLDVESNTALTKLDCSYNNIPQAAIPTIRNGALEENWITEPQTVEINETNFPDVNFREFVSNNFDSDGDGFLSNNEIAAVTSIDVSNMGIAKLKGIEYFTDLTSLDCRYNELTSLNVSENTALTELYCYNNQLTSLDVKNNTALTYLDCRYNYISKADIPTIQNGALEANWLTEPQTVEINETNFPDVNFREFVSNNFDSDGDGFLSNNEIAAVTSIDVSNMGIAKLKGIEYFTDLTSLDCGGNRLTSLDIKSNTELTTLNCANNQLTSLDVSANTALTSLECSYNELTSLNVESNTELTTLDCSYNNIPVEELPKTPDNVDKIKWKTEPQYIANLANDAITVAPIAKQLYTGSAITPVVTVSYSEMLLELDRDYTLTYSNNIEVGTATFTIEGKGNYAGKRVVEFEIVNEQTAIPTTEATPATVVGYYNLMGVRLNQEPAQGIYITLYSNGTAKKQVRVK